MRYFNFPLFKAEGQLLTGIHEHPATEDDPEGDNTSSAELEGPNWLMSEIEVEA
jgi:hypothetical protein